MSDAPTDHRTTGATGGGASTSARTPPEFRKFVEAEFPSRSPEAHRPRDAGAAS